MKKHISIFGVICVLLFLVSCHVKDTYEFCHSVEEITEISIIEIRFDEDNELVEDTVKQIDDNSVFLEKFKQIECYIWFGEPIAPMEETDVAKVIKILYANGDYELINWNGQSRYTSERGFIFYAGYNLFNEEQFLSFLDSYSAQDVE